MRYVDKRAVERFKSFEARTANRAALHAARRGRPLGDTRCMSQRHALAFIQAGRDQQQVYAERIAHLAAKARERFTRFTAPKKAPRRAA